MLVSVSLRHNRTGRLRKDGTAVVQVRAYHNRKPKFFSTGIMVEPKHWDDKRKQVNRRHPQYVTLNLHLHNFLSEFEGYQRGFIAQIKPFDLGTLQECVSGVKTTSLHDFIAREIENDVKLKEKSKAALRNTLVKLRGFRSEVALIEVDFQFLEDFDNHLRSTGLAQNTIHKQHKNLKRFLNLAIKRGLMDRNAYPYSNFKVPIEKTKRDVLTITEIGALENLCFDQEQKSYEDVRNMFLFGFYTGLRISDVVRLDQSCVHKVDEGFLLDFKTFKANKRAQLPLYNLFPVADGQSKPEQLLVHYLDQGFSNVFPSYSEPFINRHLKGLAAVNFLVSSVITSSTSSLPT